jgi:uncharacterized protein with von Willebrand factor type A (vWA) domain/MoxR-like ATPase
LAGLTGFGGEADRRISVRPQFSGAAQVVQRLRANRYFADDAVGNAVFVADQLGKPMLLEGPAGSGKTELAKAVAAATNRRLIRLQCHEGLDEARILYDWNYRKQILRLEAERGDYSPRRFADSIFTGEFLLERPLLEALRSQDQVVLLIDEVDRIGHDVEALLLEFLSEYQVSIPELGTIEASGTVPTVIITSNGTRSVSDGLRRRCINVTLDYPTAEREREIVLARLPDVVDGLVARVATAIESIIQCVVLRERNIGAAIEWARVVVLLGADTIGLEPARQALDVLNHCENDPAHAAPQDAAPASAPEIDFGHTVLDMVSMFVAELRDGGVDVSLSEHLDAIDALRHVRLLDRGAVKAALAATLVTKNRQWATFGMMFDAYFSLVGIERRLQQDRHHNHNPRRDALLAQLLSHAAVHAEHRPNPLEGLSAEQLADRLFHAVFGSDEESMGPLATEAIARFGSMDTTAPLAYYMYKTLRGIDVEALLARMAQEMGASHYSSTSAMGARLTKDEMTARLAEMEATIEAEIRRRMLGDAGADTSDLFGSMTEDVDFALASRDELAQMHDAIEPLARKLSSRLVHKRKHLRRGRVDIRNTVRHSMSYGGVLAEPKFKNRRPQKPEIVVLADISGSVAAFTRFSLHFVYAMHAHFSKVATFVFVDAVNDVTKLLDGEDEVVTAVKHIIQQTDKATVAGCSDYGQVFESFRDDHADALNSRSTLLILGDARTNDTEPNVAAFKDLATRARSVFWLNPEPKRFWDTRDSMVSTYSPHCEMHECRNLRQLEELVELIG